jgi:acyl carrier protein
MDNTEIKNKVTNLLADQLGVDVDDIHETDSLKDDLHLNPSDLSELFETLDKNGFDTSSLVMADIETFEELVDAISTKEPF